MTPDDVLRETGPEPPPVGAPAAAWIPYLVGRGTLTRPASPVPAAALTGGVSYEVARVGDVVVKRPRPLLDVPGHWPADPRRALAEADAMARFPAFAPPVLDVDAAELVVTIGFVDGVTWRDDLLRGHVDEVVARRVAAALREIHAVPFATIPAVHSGELLRAPQRFEELRLTPYFAPLRDTVPEAAAAVADVADRLRATRTHLVHGDYSPKNVLVGPGRVVTVLDWEVASLGDPVFDLAFLLTHLVAKAEHVPAARAALLDAVDATLDEYGPVDRAWLARVLGALLLARVAGLSRLTYLGDAARAAVRALGTRLVREEGAAPWER